MIRFPCPMQWISVPTQRVWGSGGRKKLSPAEQQDVVGAGGRLPVRSGPLACGSVGAFDSPAGGRPSSAWTSSGAGKRVSGPWFQDRASAPESPPGPTQVAGNGGVKKRDGGR